ncbi:MAG TPA: class I SAM-dependent rRNA methyltransferase [Vicinamibacterales bacterium]|nr:class I SAM-dependent rRNA methyltransferase [Vicinamibacterales bacterium]
MSAIVRLSPRGEERLRRGHAWIYRSDLASAEAEPGDLVTVVGPRGRQLGTALFSDRSQIALRMLTRGEEDADADLWRRRLEQAVRFRSSLDLDASAYRVVHGEGDRLPGLVVDRYDRWLVVQALVQGTDRRLPELTELLVERLQPEGILARNDARVRLLEGLERNVRELYGTVPETVAVHEDGIRYEADLRRGQKTGLFLDQRENRAAAAQYAAGRLLDCFSYNGGFALRLAGRCHEIIALDVSADAAARIRRNASLNGVSHIEAREANVFDELRTFERRGERFDTIVLDPPAFAKNKSAVPKALAGYKEINLRALRILNTGGVLVTCSCSYNVSDELFLDVLRDAAIDARAEVSIVERRTQGRDHPVLLGVPETGYLKCVILRKLA